MWLPCVDENWRGPHYSLLIEGEGRKRGREEREGGRGRGKGRGRKRGREGEGKGNRGLKKGQTSECEKQEDNLLRMERLREDKREVNGKGQKIINRRRYKIRYLVFMVGIGIQFDG